MDVFFLLLIECDSDTKQETNSLYMKNEIIFNIMSAVSFVGILFLSSVLVYSNVTKDKRLLKNRKFMEKVIEQQVNIQIRESMPNQSGGVNVGNTEN